MSDDTLKEYVQSGNWPMAAGRLLALAVEASQGNSQPSGELFMKGAEAMRSVTIETVRAAYRKIERGEGTASSVIGTLLEGLKRFDVGELLQTENNNEAQGSPTGQV